MVCSSTQKGNLVSQTKMRPASEVMRLERMGSFFPTRLSFLRSLLRKLAGDEARVERPVFDLDENGFGEAVYQVTLDERPYSLIAYARPLNPEDRTDRVIAQAWDACFVLFDGQPNAKEIQQIKGHAITQEAGRYNERVLVLSRANKSVRLFEHVVASLAEGKQPDAAMIGKIGYLMRTTAVYGNGKFGMADRADFLDRPSLSHPFRLEMLTVYLIREFTLDLVEHIAKIKGADEATTLSNPLRRQLGIGNSTGLGMAPFLVGHPVLINNWMKARETALARVRALKSATDDQLGLFNTFCTRVSRHLQEWCVDDAEEQRRIENLRDSWAMFSLALPNLLTEPCPWNAVIEASHQYSVDLQELVVALVLEPNGTLIDDLCDDMDDKIGQNLEPAMSVADLTKLLEEHYAWALEADLSAPDSRAMMWYVSEEKAEPRLGERPADSQERQEMPHHIAHKVQLLSNALSGFSQDAPVGLFLSKRPCLRDIVKRVQTVAHHPYGEIQDNLVAQGVRPIDLLRCKLSFFGASKFDPRSDRWTRITLFQGAPTASELSVENESDVFLPAFGDEKP